MNIVKLVSKHKGKVMYIVGVGLGIMLFMFFVLCSWIGHEIKQRCQTAQNQYGGDCVTALSTLLTDDKNNFESRNYAIWSLGQIGDKRALPVLKSYYTGIIPEREPYALGLSQYELRKAIALLEGGTNIGAFIWRYMIVGK